MSVVASTRSPPVGSAHVRRDVFVPADLPPGVQAIDRFQLMSAWRPCLKCGLALRGFSNYNGRMEKELTDRARLVAHLTKCVDAGVDADLSPELVQIALRALRLFEADGAYRLESIGADGSVTVLAAVSDPKLLRTAYGAATVRERRNALRVRCGTQIISIDTTPS
jgi:hypothetical protein